MKIRSVAWNNRRKSFAVRTSRETLWLPFARLDVVPTRADPVVEARVDPDLGCEGFVYALASGRTGTVHVDQVLEYNQDPEYMRDLMLYRLTIEAQKRLVASPLSKRELIRRLGTSATQFYRLLDQTNYSKSLDQMLGLLHVLDCEVEMTVRDRLAWSRK